MKQKLHFHTLAIVVLLAWCWGFSESISYPTIKSLYKEGELDKIRITLEAFLKKNGPGAQTKDKIFAFKYLGVIYAAEPHGYPLAENYFYQLFKLAPNAHISDLYVSAPIQELFERSYELYRKELRDNLEFDEFGNPRTGKDSLKGVSPTPAEGTATKHQDANPIPSQGTDTRKPPVKDHKLRTWPWISGAAVITLVGGYWWYSSQKKEAKPNIFKGTAE
jgi:tetratricopeptide (TPR) repeat protein